MLRLSGMSTMTPMAVEAYETLVLRKGEGHSPNVELSPKTLMSDTRYWFDNMVKEGWDRLLPLAWQQAHCSLTPGNDRSAIGSSGQICRPLHDPK